MKNYSKMLILLYFAVLLEGCYPKGNTGEIKATGVRFATSDTVLQKVFNLAEKECLNNIYDFKGYKVLVEGAGYNNVWLETQPMGGVMYAKRDIEIARNNVEIFIDCQRKDGRMPGLVRNEKDSLNPDFFRFQGNCFPMPAFELYYWLGKDKAYLQKLYKCLEMWDNYVWKTRDSDNNGCLESWCRHDTGEDNNVRFGAGPSCWPYEFPPSKEKLPGLSLKQDEMDNLFVEKVILMTKEQKEEWNNRGKIFRELTGDIPVPLESMDIMSYSYSNRDVLSLISQELKNGKDTYWRGKATEVRKKLKDYLWNSDKKACYDRDKNNEVMDILLHNNLRCMWYGAFDQEMAEGFVRNHLFNPEEFWTPCPLPSIAANDPKFRNISGNDWSGQPQALTFQRSISALENYGYFSELTAIGTKFLEISGKHLRFPQQYDPFTAIPNEGKTGYGPGLLSALEFISRLYGVHYSQDKLYWSCLDNGHDYSYSQQWGDKTFSMTTVGKQVICSINSKEVFSFTKGARIISDLTGRPLEVIGIESGERKIEIKLLDKVQNISVRSNEIYSLKKP